MVPEKMHMNRKCHSIFHQINVQERQKEKNVTQDGLLVQVKCWNFYVQIQIESNETTFNAANGNIPSDRYMVYE